MNIPLYDENHFVLGFLFSDFLKNLLTPANTSFRSFTEWFQVLFPRHFPSLFAYAFPLQVRYNFTRLPWDMQSVINQNVITWRMTVLDVSVLEGYLFLDPFSTKGSFSATNASYYC